MLGVLVNAAAVVVGGLRGMLFGRLLNDRFAGHGIQCINVTPLPPPTSLGLLRLRAVPLSTAAKPMATLFARYLAA